MIRVKGGLYMSENKNIPQDVRNQGEWNFSPFTGEKLNDVCLNCWVKKNHIIVGIKNVQEENY